jgi:hypothetical protein
LLSAAHFAVKNEGWIYAAQQRPRKMRLSNLPLHGLPRKRRAARGKNLLQPDLRLRLHGDNVSVRA